MILPKTPRSTHSMARPARAATCTALASWRGKCSATCRRGCAHETAPTAPTPCSSSSRRTCRRSLSCCAT
eukprot:329321-Chlamydomonas_euryale.AAC.1